MKSKQEKNMITYISKHEDEENGQMWWHVIDGENQDILSRFEDDSEGMQDAVLDSMWYGYYDGAVKQGLSSENARHHADKVMTFHKDLKHNLGVTQ
jgi:hypothetical protein